MQFFQSGHSEVLKRELHRGMKYTAGAFALYNAIAWLLRKESHLATNAVVYTLLWALEDAHVKHHDRSITE